MSLFKFERTEYDPDFKKTVFMRLVSLHTIRVLSEKSFVTFLHWINRVPIKCLGDDCPVCKQNKLIILENPNTFRKVSTYSARRQTFYLNVLDRTVVKVCTNCGAENLMVANRFPPTCESCSILINDIEPASLNKVKVLSRGITFGEDLNNIHMSYVNDAGDIIGIKNYDVQIMVGANKQPFPQAVLTSNDKVDVPDSELFDLESAPISLEGDEMLDLQRGVSLKDIFAARSSDDVEVESETVEVLEDAMIEKLTSNVQSLMGLKEIEPPPF